MTAPATDSLSGIVEIVASLTKAQREALYRLDREWRFLGLASRPDKCHPVIERRNRPYGGYNYRLTPLGLAVKQHMEKES